MQGFYTILLLVASNIFMTCAFLFLVAAVYLVFKK